MDLLQLWSRVANWQDIVDHLLLILGAICVAAVPSLFAARNHKGIQEVKNQVKNAHTTNLRDDIDRAINAVETLGHDVRGIRTDLAAEEDRRRQQIRELRDDVERRLNRG
jgi:uncharacterized protein (UPF0264 family)